MNLLTKNVIKIPQFFQIYFMFAMNFEVNFTQLNELLNYKNKK